MCNISGCAHIVKFMLLHFFVRCMHGVRWSNPEILHTLDPSLLSFLVVPLVRELRSTRSCDFLNRGGGFIKGILRGVRCTKSLRVPFYIDGHPTVGGPHRGLVK